MTATDISRWNRKARRNVTKQMGGKLLGRNLPYTKSLHGSLENYKKLREAELSQEQDANKEEINS